MNTASAAGVPPDHMRVLLDEHFPSPPGFDPQSLDAAFEVTSLRDFDSRLVGTRTPDWYLYLVADKAGFDALVTRDSHQSAQVEEMWVATRTTVSIITWRNPLDDPVVEWAQLLAYMPQLRKLRDDHGPSVFLLPKPSLSREHVRKASDQLSIMAVEQGRARQEVREASRNVEAWLVERDLLEPYADILGGV